MRFFLGFAALAIPFASTPAHTPIAARAPAVAPVIDLGTGTDKRKCQRADVHRAIGDNKGEFNRLGELPAGQLVLAVVREVDGCNEPVIVRRDFGFGSAEQGRAAPQAEMPRARRW